MGQSEPDVSGRGPRELHVVAEAERERGAQPVLILSLKYCRRTELIMNSVDQFVDEYKRAIDRTLLRENLQRTPDERLLNLMELQRLAEELKRAGEQHRAQR